MSLDKAIAHGKEHRRPYQGSKRFDPACRTNTCPWCLGNVRHATRKREIASRDALDCFGRDDLYADTLMLVTRTTSQDQDDWE